jgi:hypothetical protein
MKPSATSPSSTSISGASVERIIGKIKGRIARSVPKDGAPAVDVADSGKCIYCHRKIQGNGIGDAGPDGGGLRRSRGERHNHEGIENPKVRKGNYVQEKKRVEFHIIGPGYEIQEHIYRRKFPQGTGMKTESY